MLTVVQGDSPEDAEVGLLEALLATAALDELGQLVLRGVVVTISTRWPGDLHAETVLRSPFTELAGQDRVSARGSTDGRTWACFDLRAGVLAVTTATWGAEALSAIDDVWQQVLLAGQTRYAEGPPIRNADVTIHFQTVRLSDSRRAEAMRRVRGWAPDRTQ